MAIIANTFTRYSAIGIREDLSNIIYNISPEQTPFVSNTQKDTVRNTFFEWQTDELAAAAVNAQLDGDDVASFTAVTPTARVGNYTMISRKDVILADNLEQIDEAGRSSERAYQITKRGNELKRDVEFNLVGVNATATAGNTTTARKTGSLAAWIITNTSKGSNGADNAAGTARTDGTQRAFTEAMLKTVVQSVYTQGGTPKLLMVGPFNKTVVSGFAGIAAQRYQAPDGPTTIIGAADVYVSDFGSISITPNRFSRERDAYVLDPDLTAVCYLRPIHNVELAKTGDASKEMILVEYGLRVDQEKGLGLVADLTAS